MDLLARVAAFPGQPGDYSTRNDQGRDIEHLKLDKWEISYWVDDPVRELRIVEINEV